MKGDLAEDEGGGEWRSGATTSTEQSKVNERRREDRWKGREETQDSGNGEEYCGQDVVRGYSSWGGWKVCWRRVVRGHHWRNHSKVDSAESGKSVGAGVVRFLRAQALTVGLLVGIPDGMLIGVTGSFIDPLEEFSAALQIRCGPDLLENVDGVQCLGFCIFEPALFIRNPSLQLHRAGQTIRMVYRLRLGTFDVGVRVIGPALLGEQPCQGVMYPKQVIDPVER